MFESHLKPPISFPTLTGSIVTFNSQYAGLPLKSHTIALTATQSGSGTPSPDNVRPISGVDSIHIQNTCGINQWDEQWEVGGINANTGANANFNDRIRCKSYIYVNGLSSIGIYASTQYLTVVFYDKNRQYISGAQGASAVRNVPNNAYFMRFSLGSDYGTTYNHDFSVNYPSSDTTYHAFEGQSFTIQIGSTVYGGEYDARTGVLTVTHKGVVFDGSESWNYHSASGSLYLENAFTNSNFITNSANPVCLCNWLAESDVIGNSSEMSSKPDDIFCNQGEYKSRLWVKMTQFTTVTDFKNYLSSNNLVIVYPLATPTTIQLPPCPIDVLEGVNNIWADTGDTTLSYITIG